MIGTLVKSKAGHDKGTIYIVIKEDEKNVYVMLCKVYVKLKKQTFPSFLSVSKTNWKSLQILKITD